MNFEDNINYIINNYNDGDEIFAFYTMSYNGHSSVSVEEIFIQELQKIASNNYNLGNKGLYGMKRYIKFELLKKGIDF